MEPLQQLKLKSKMRNRLSGCSATKLVDIEPCQQNHSPAGKDGAEGVSVYMQQNYINHTATGLSENKDRHRNMLLVQGVTNLIADAFAGHIKFQGMCV